MHLPSIQHLTATQIDSTFFACLYFYLIEVLVQIYDRVLFLMFILNILIVYSEKVLLATGYFWSVSHIFFQLNQKVTLDVRILHVNFFM